MVNMIDLKKIRNIGFIAHIDAGKTTTTERILYYTGKIHKHGEVDEGSTITDWMPEEKQRGITITAAATTCYWGDNRINIIDTPGHVDFTAEVERTLRVLDGAVIIFSAVEGVESQSETVWYQADRYNVPRIVYINKLDRVGANVEKCLNMMSERLGIRPIVLQLPVGIEEGFSTLVDLISMKLLLFEELKVRYEEIPESLKETARLKRKEMLESIALYNDSFAEEYLNPKSQICKGLINQTSTEISQKEVNFIKESIRAIVINHLPINHSPRAVPVLFGASIQNIGIQPILDSIVEYLPSPLDVPLIVAQNPLTGKKEEISLKDRKSLLALVFKIYNDSHGGLVYLRIYSGVLKQGGLVYNAQKKKKERILRIFLLHGDKRVSLQEAHAGEIVGVYGLKDVVTGDTITDISSPLLLETLYFPEPVLSCSIEPKSREDAEKLEWVLEKIAQDDPTIKIKTDNETGQFIISGMGELHLEVVKNRMEKDFSFHANIGTPQVAFKETIKDCIRKRGEFIKQSGGKGQYGDVEIEIIPTKRDEGIAFENCIKNGSIPFEFIPAIEKGIKESMESGILAGFPVVDVKVRLVGGSSHPVDSSDIAFKIAASIAFKEASKDANPVLLEPVMKIEIITHSQYVGAILSDMGGRGGKVLGLSGDASHTIKALCPLRKLFGYASALRSLTQGRVVHMVEFDSYKEVPLPEQDVILQKMRGY